MTVIARDGVAADHLVYPWPFPIGPECEVACSEDEQVVMCPAWMVGDRLGPGHHRWRTPDPTRPVGAFFVLTSPVEISFDMVTTFMIPATGMPVRLRAAGSVQVRCADPGLLIAQFVGLPFDQVNDGVVRSVRRSVERMLARLLTRRVVMAGSPVAVTDSSTLTNIVEELVAYNPTAGAVFGVELIRMGYVMVAADDNSTPFLEMPVPDHHHPEHHHLVNGHSNEHITEPQFVPAGPSAAFERPPAEEPAPVSAVETTPPPPTKPVDKPISASASSTASGEIGGKKPAAITPETSASASGEIGGSAPAKVREPRATIASAAVPMPNAPRRAAPIAVPDVPKTEDAVKTPPLGTPAKKEPESIMGIGMGAIGRAQPASDSGSKVNVGGRVLVPGPNGLMQSATVRQMMSGYYELEIGSTGQTVWVPVAGVVPD